MQRYYCTMEVRLNGWFSLLSPRSRFLDAFFGCSGVLVRVLRLDLSTVSVRFQISLAAAFDRNYYGRARVLPAGLCNHS